ncbi:MAG: hypothetical protein ABF649_13880 [Bacillus sp. (in: firmicutes)]
MSFRTVGELIALCMERNQSISEVMIESENNLTGKNKEDIMLAMEKNLQVMEQAVNRGLIEQGKSITGLTGGDAVLLGKYLKEQNPLSPPEVCHDFSAKYEWWQ